MVLNRLVLIFIIRLYQYEKNLKKYEYSLFVHSAAFFQFYKRETLEAFDARIDLPTKTVILPWHAASKQIGAAKTICRAADENGKQKIRTNFKRFRYLHNEQICQLTLRNSDFVSTCISAVNSFLNELTLCFSSELRQFSVYQR